MCELFHKSFNFNGIQMGAFGGREKNQIIMDHLYVADGWTENGRVDYVCNIGAKQIKWLNPH